MSFENTRIYRILSSMDAVTLNRFSKFIHSPYFNKNQKITSLFDITHNDLKKGNAVKSKETLWTMVGFADGYKDRFKSLDRRTEIQFRIGRLYYLYNHFDEAEKNFKEIIGNMIKYITKLS